MEYRLTFKEYNKALRQNRLLGLKCSDCGTVTCPPMMVCSSCAGTGLEAVQLSGTGRIVTFTTTYIAPGGRENEVPYTIVMVELDEGPWIMGNLVDMDNRDVTMDVIGKKVRLSSRVFPGDIYSSGDAARPGFSFVK